MKTPDHKIREIYKELVLAISEAVKCTEVGDSEIRWDEFIELTGIRAGYSVHVFNYIYKLKSPDYIDCLIKSKALHSLAYAVAKMQYQASLTSEERK